MYKNFIDLTGSDQPVRSYYNHLKLQNMLQYETFFVSQ